MAFDWKIGGVKNGANFLKKGRKFIKNHHFWPFFRHFLHIFAHFCTEENIEKCQKWSKFYKILQNFAKSVKFRKLGSNFGHFSTKIFQSTQIKNVKKLEIRGCVHRCVAGVNFVHFRGRFSHKIFQSLQSKTMKTHSENRVCTRGYPRSKICKNRFRPTHFSSKIFQSLRRKTV
jgi:hypothetical protein